MYSWSVCWSVLLHGIHIARICAWALICVCHAQGQIDCQNVVLVDNGQRWPVSSWQMVAVLYTVEKFTLSCARVFLMQPGSTAPHIAKDFGCHVKHSQMLHSGSTSLSILSFMPPRVFQRWPYCLLDLDVFNILYGEMGPAARWYALLCPTKTVLCQWW